MLSPSACNLQWPHRLNPLMYSSFLSLPPGHILLMLDMAKLLAARGVYSTILTTHANAPLVRPSIGPHVKLHLIDFSSGTNLPEGCEKLSNIPRLVFHGSNLFASCILDSTARFKPYEHAVPDAEFLRHPWPSSSNRGAQVADTERAENR